MEIDPTEFIPPEAAAKALGQRVSTLAQWRAAGQGPKYFKIGRKVFYTPQFLTDYLNGKVVDPAAKCRRAA